jgi:hypothetical protein
MDPQTMQQIQQLLMNNPQLMQMLYNNSQQGGNQSWQPAANATVNAGYGVGAVNPMSNNLTTAQNPNSLYTTSYSGSNPYTASSSGGGNNSSSWNPSIRGGSDIGNILYNMFGSYTNPSDAASKYLNQIGGTISPYYQPYINAGMGAMGDLQSQYKNLLSNPTAIMNQIGSTFKASPGYQYNVNKATQGANSAAAAGGFAGSPAEQAALAGQISGLASQDYNNYMNQGLGLYGQGLNVAQGINQMGYGASNELAQSLMSALMTQAQNAYSGANNQNQQSGGLWGSIGDLLML